MKHKKPALLFLLALCLLPLAPTWAQNISKIDQSIRDYLFQVGLTGPSTSGYVWTNNGTTGGWAPIPGGAAFVGTEATFTSPSSNTIQAPNGPLDITALKDISISTPNGYFQLTDAGGAYLGNNFSFLGIDSAGGTRLTTGANQNLDIFSGGNLSLVSIGVLSLASLQDDLSIGTQNGHSINVSPSGGFLLDGHSADYDVRLRSDNSQAELGLLRTGEVHLTNQNGGITLRPDGTLLGGSPVYDSQSHMDRTAQDSVFVTTTTPPRGGRFRVSGGLVITVHGSEAIQMWANYTDRNAVSRTVIFPLVRQDGSTVTVASGEGAYCGVPVEIDCYGSTTISIGTIGTFAGVHYNDYGTIEQH